MELTYYDNSFSGIVSEHDGMEPEEIVLALKERMLNQLETEKEVKRLEDELYRMKSKLESDKSGFNHLMNFAKISFPITFEIDGYYHTIDSGNKIQITKNNLSEYIIYMNISKDIKF